MSTVTLTYTQAQTVLQALEDYLEHKVLDEWPYDELQIGETADGGIEMTAVPTNVLIGE